MLAWIVGTIARYTCPEECKQLLCFAEFQLLEYHVVGLGCFEGHDAHREAVCRVVGGGDWGGFRLRIAHFFQRYSVWCCVFASVVKNGRLLLGC